MDKQTDYILTNLKIIALVKINEKLSIYRGHLQINYTSLQFLKRWINKDSRQTLISFLIDLIQKIYTMFKENNQESIYPILNELDTVNNGINNLKITYADDAIIVVKLDTINKHFKTLSTYGRTLII